MSMTHHLSLVPRDGLFCKDGRGWHTSASGRGHALDWPWPSTVLGALRTAWGREEESRARIRFTSGQWKTRTADIDIARTLVLRRPPGNPWSMEHRVWPVPADAVRLEGRAEVHALEPRPPRVGTLGVVDDAREGLWTPNDGLPSKPLELPPWWHEDHFVRWLRADAKERRVPVLSSEDALRVSRRVQAHVGIDPVLQTADEGILFSHDVVESLELEAEWAIGAEVSLPTEATPDIATLGSDGRLARMEALPSTMFEPPAELLEEFEQKGPRGLRLVVVTPACFARGWLPDGLVDRDDSYRGFISSLETTELVLRSAMVPRPVHISGWDMAANNGRGAPRPTSRMVPPGAVYFIERADGRPFGGDAVRALWLASLGSRTEQGFGRVVPGAWSPQ